MHINTIGENLKSNIQLSADDALLYRRSDTTDDKIIQQEDLKSLDNWSRNSTTAISRRESRLFANDERQIFANNGVRPKGCYFENNQRGNGVVCHQG